jgi:hypothetical protein
MASTKKTGSEWMRCSKSVVKFSGGMGGMAYVVEGGVGVGVWVMLWVTGYVLSLAAPASARRGGIWQKYLPMVNICRIMCIMDAIMYADYL